MSLATRYLGFDLKSPLVASASPLNGGFDTLRRLEDCGAGAVVLPSVSQEQIEAEANIRDSRISVHAECSPEAQSYFPADVTGPYGTSPDIYLDHVRRAREAVAIPIIASLNGSSTAGWIQYARLIEEAGASAIELNMYHVPTDLVETGHDVELRYVSIVKAVRDTVALPISIKLTPFLTSLGSFAATLVDEGADGLVLFNRSMQPVTRLRDLPRTGEITLSEPDESGLPLLWTSIMAGRIRASLAISTGVQTVADVVKGLLAGADVVMTTSALLRHDSSSMQTLNLELADWMGARQFQTLDDLRGLMSWRNSHDRPLDTRANHLGMPERSPIGHGSPRGHEGAVSPRPA